MRQRVVLEFIIYYQSLVIGGRSRIIVLSGRVDLDGGGGNGFVVEGK